MVEADLIDYLLTQSEVTNLVSDRIYPMVFPTDCTFPAITVSLISRSPRRDLGGVQYWSDRFQISCWHDSLYGSAKKIAAAVKQVLEDYVGAMGASHIIDSITANEIDLNEPDTGMYHVAVDVLIIHK